MKPPSSLVSAMRSTNSAPRRTPNVSKSARVVGNGLNVLVSCQSWPMAMRMIGGSYRLDRHHAMSEDQIREPTGCGLDRKLGNQENGRMQTTSDFPDARVKPVKLRALPDGPKLNAPVAGSRRH